MNGKKVNTQKKKLFGLSVKGKGCPDASLKMPSQYYRKWAIENVNEHTKQTKKKKNFNVSFVPDISKCFKRVEFVVTFVRLDYRYNKKKESNWIETKHIHKSVLRLDSMKWCNETYAIPCSVHMCVCLAEPIGFCSQKICDIIYMDI